MSNVIVVNFRNQTVLGREFVPGEFTNLDEYLEFLYNQGLDTDDILDLNDAILDFNFFQSTDSVIQDLASFWFSYTNQM